MTELREYQKAAVENLRQALTRNKHVILQASCGAGKTVISADIASRAIEKGRRVLFIVNRRDLVTQTVEKYEQYGLGDEVGIILAGKEPSLGKPIQCASLQTYGRRLGLEDISVNKWFHDADLVIYDEVHSCNAPTYRKIVENYKDKYIVGLSATPMGAGGTGLGEVFDEIVTCVPTADLVRDGFLVPAIHYAPSTPDLKGVGMLGNDYNGKQLDKRVNKPKVIGSILENWLRLASDRKTLIFALNVLHSKHIVELFSSNGIRIAHIDAHTNDEERAEIYYQFEHGDLQIITNVGVACEGSDLPVASAICVARPTKVLSRWLQMAGRGARPYPGKKDYLLLDFAGCIDEHGYVDDPVEWQLDAKKPAAEKKIDRTKKEKKIITCEFCKAAFTGKRCPVCGHEFVSHGKKVEFAEADLVIVKGELQKAKEDEQRTFISMLEYERRLRGYKQGWVYHQFIDKFKVAPEENVEVVPLEPDITFKNWMVYKRIRASKSKKRQQKEA